MILAANFGDLAIATAVIVICQLVVAVLIGKRLAHVNRILETRHAIVVPDELGPDDRIVIWHKDEEPPVELVPDDPPKDKNPIVGLE